MVSRFTFKAGQKRLLYAGNHSREFTRLPAKGDLDAQEKGGGSAVCYTASYCDGSGLSHYGKLKAFSLRRDDEEFEQKAEEYISAYRQLQKIVSDNRDMALLYAFIPDFEIYYDEDKRPYIWTNEVPMLTFEEVCSRLRRGNGRVEDYLYQVVRTLKSLTDCIRILHKHGLIHGDITLSNFGFYLRDDQVLADGVSLFDLDSLRRVQEEPKTYTLPYYDSWVHNDGDRGYQADVRAIGVCLCKALYCSDDQIEQIKEENYRRGRKKLGDILFADTFFQKRFQNAAGEDPVREQIVSVVAETVTRMASKCTLSCTTLYQRLQKLETYLLPDCTKSELGRGLGIEIINKEERRKNTVRRVFQYLLYDRPLYRWQRDGEPYRVLLFGFGLDAQNFLDVCLEMGQSMNAPLEVSVWGTDRIWKEKEDYLKERPALGQFFLVDGRANKLTGKESYGRIRFNQRRHAQLREQVKRAVEHCAGRVQYIYIAAGNDEENEAIAQAFAALLADPIERGEVSVNAQCERGRDDAGGIHFVCIEEKMKKTRKHDEIERMAFNAHLVWSGSLNTDLEKKRGEYDADYFHASCTSLALSIKYKLYTLGIDVGEGPYAAADKLRKLLRDSPAHKDDMIAAEHRRWVTEKLCDGWTNMSVKDSLPYNDTKDFLGKRHICILRSRKECGLRRPKWQDRKAWDRASAAELAELDELDKMSVRLHQAYHRKMGKIDDAFGERFVKSILSETEGRNDIQQLFLEWLSCQRDLYRELFAEHAGMKPNIMEYETLYTRLISKINNQETGVENELKRQSILNKIAAIYRDFLPVARGLRYYDYKKNDIDLIEKIPFILTYTSDTTLIVPVDYDILIRGWSDVNPTALFSYVAAATVINPGRVYMPYIAPGPKRMKQKDRETIEQKKNAIRRYFKRKGLRAEVEFKPLRTRTSIREIVDLDTGRGPEGWILWDQSGPDILDTEGLPASRAAGYTFDMISRTFQGGSPAWLNDIGGDVHITVRDVACFFQKDPDIKTQPAFSKADIRSLWEIYSADKVTWKKICRVLKTRENKNDPIVQFRRSSTAGLEEHTFILPYTCFQSASDVLALLENHGIIKKARIFRCSVDACKAVVQESIGCKQELDRLFSNLYLLMAAENYSVSKQDNIWTLQCDSLCVPVPLSEFGGSAVDKAMAVLEKLRDEGFIRLITHEESVDITYGSRQIKDLFMEEGRILEVYTYYKAREQNQFDDIVTGISMWEREKTDKDKEFDCFVTKGFQTAIVECKAWNKLKKTQLLEMIKELQDKMQKYGINGTGLMVLDSRSRYPEMEEFRNIAICPREKIEDVGQVIYNQINLYEKG